MIGISTTTQLYNSLLKLLVETFITAVDEDGNEYVIECIKQTKLHSDDDTQWYYSLKLNKTSTGCIKR